MTSTRRRGEVERVLDRCRAVWAFSDVPEERIEDMAAELETHLRQRLADGGTIVEVVGTDIDGFARGWASEEGVEPTRPQRLLRWLTPPVLSTAVFLLASHVMVAARGDGWRLELSASTVGLLSMLVVASLVIFRPRVLRWLLAEGGTKRAFIAGAVAWVSLLGLAFLSEGVSRALGLDGTVAWPWPLTATLVVAAVALTVLSHRSRPRTPVAARGGP